MAPDLQAPWTTPRGRQAWLRAVHRKVKKDSERLVAAARDLHKEATKPEPSPLALPVLERIQALAVRAEALRKEVAAVDENILSVSVVTGAEDIKSEARSLHETFAEDPSVRRREKCRQLAREIERHASSVAGGMSMP